MRSSCGTSAGGISFYLAFRKALAGKDGRVGEAQLCLTRQAVVDVGEGIHDVPSQEQLGQVKYAVLETELDEDEFGVCMGLLNDATTKSLNILAVHETVLLEKSSELLQSIGTRSAYDWVHQLKSEFTSRNSNPSNYFYVLYYSQQADLKKFREYAGPTGNLSDVSLSFQKQPSFDEINLPEMRMEVLLIIIGQSSNFINYLKNVLVAEKGTKALLVVKEAANFEKIRKLEDSYYFGIVGKGAEGMRAYDRVLRSEEWLSLRRKNKEATLLLTRSVCETVTKGVGVLKKTFKGFNASLAEEYLNVQYNKEAELVYLFCKALAKSACLGLLEKSSKISVGDLPQTQQKEVNPTGLVPACKKRIPEKAIPQQPFKNPFIESKKQEPKRTMKYLNRSDSDLQTDSSFEDQVRISHEVMLRKLPIKRILPLLPLMENLLPQFQELSRQSFQCQISLQEGRVLLLEGSSDNIDAFLNKIKLELLKETYLEPTKSCYSLLELSPQEKLMLKEITGMYFRCCKKVECESRTNQWQIKLLNDSLQYSRVEAPWVYACEGGPEWAERLLESLQKTGKTGQKCLHLYTDTGNFRRRANSKGSYIIFRLILSDNSLNGKELQHYPEENRFDHYFGDNLLPVFYISRV